MSGSVPSSVVEEDVHEEKADQKNQQAKGTYEDHLVVIDGLVAFIQRNKILCNPAHDIVLFCNFSGEDFVPNKEELPNDKGNYVDSEKELPPMFVASIAEGA